MEGKWLLGLGEERHRRWVMAERLWGKRTERWGAGQRQVGVAMLALEDLENQAEELGLDPAWGAGKLGQGVQAEAGSGGV